MLAIALVLGAGCANVGTNQYRGWTAGVIGCPANEIKVTEQKNVVWAGQAMDWRAECRGHRFVCSYSGATACKEELQPAPAAAAAAGPAAAGAGPAALEPAAAPR
jgi:hypothetical protein